MADAHEEDNTSSAHHDNQPFGVGMNDGADATTNDLPNNSGDYTITDDTMAPQVHEFGEYYEQPTQLPTNYFNIPFPLEPGTDDDHDDWFEVEGDGRIIERDRREKSILEEIEGPGVENYFLNKHVDQLTSVVGSDKENIDAKRKREMDMDWSITITKEDIIDAKTLEVEIAAMKAKRQKCEEYLAATAFVEELS